MSTMTEKRIEKQFKAIGLSANGLKDREICLELDMKITTLRKWKSDFKTFSRTFALARKKHRQQEAIRKELVTLDENPEDEENRMKEVFLTSLYANNGNVTIASRQTGIELDRHYRWVVEDHEYHIKAGSCTFALRDISQHVIMQALTASSPFLLDENGDIKLDEHGDKIDNLNYIQMEEKAKLAIKYFQIAKDDVDLFSQRIESINKLLGKTAKSAVTDFSERPKPKDHNEQKWNQAITEHSLLIEENEKDEEDIVVT